MSIGLIEFDVATVLWVPVNVALLRFDVLVDAEDVFRIILALDLDEAIIVFAVGSTHAFVALLISHEVHVATRVGVGPQRLMIGAQRRYATFHNRRVWVDREQIVSR